MSLIAIVETFSNDEKQEFVLYQRRKNRRNDVKNEQLFKLICSGHTTNLDELIYGKPSLNSYHALSKRLQDNLVDFIAAKSFAGETSEELAILKILLASRIFFERKAYKVAFKTLKKAEKLALQFEIYALLNEIYHTKIQYAHHNSDIDIDQLVTLSGNNMARYQQEIHLNSAYAVIKAKLRKGDSQIIKELVQSTFARFGIRINESLSYKSLYQLMEITAHSAKLQNDFYSVAPFMFSLYQIVQEKKTLQEKHKFYHIHILNLLAITEFRKKNFEKSMKLVHQMQQLLGVNLGAHYKQFSKKIAIIKALNFNYTNRPQLAIKTLAQISEKSLDAKLLMVMCFFQQEEFSKVYDGIKSFNHSDNWYEKKMGWIWVLKKNLIEILVLTELDKLDLVLLRLKRFKVKFSKQLQKIGEERVLTFVKLIAEYYEDQSKVQSEAFKIKVENSFDRVSTHEEDIFVMSFYAWLKAKMVNENIYKVTLQLVKV